MHANLLVFGFNLAFYILPFSEDTSYGISFGVLATIPALLLLPLVFLIMKGEKIRENQGSPFIHQDL